MPQPITLVLTLARTTKNYGVYEVEVPGVDFTRQIYLPLGLPTTLSAQLVEEDTPVLRTA
jgi:hypothetical protein